MEKSIADNEPYFNECKLKELHEKTKNETVAQVRILILTETYCQNSDSFNSISNSF